MKCIAGGRAYELGARATHMQRRWERNGRLVHKPVPKDEDQQVLVERLTRLTRRRGLRVDRDAPALLTCGENDCSVVAAT